MFEAPGREALIRTALDSFREDILPTLEGERKYVGLMIASALSTAIREFEADRDGDAQQRVLDAFAHLYGEDNVARSGGDLGARLESLNGHLAAEIRDGVYDAKMLGQIFAVLTVQAEEKLKLSNPKFLAAREYSQPTPS